MTTENEDRVTSVASVGEERSMGMNRPDSIAPLSLSTVGESPSLQFEQASLRATENEVAVPLTPTYKSYRKLEVVSSRRINFIAKVYITVSLIALVLSLAVIIIARTVFSETFHNLTIVLDRIPTRIISISVYTFPKFFTAVDASLAIGVFILVVMLFALYVFILFREGRKRLLNEQVWVVMLLASAVVYLNPHEPILRIRRDFMGIAPPVREDGFSYLDILTSLSYVSFIMIYWLYLWFGAHSYRFLRRRVSVKDWRFYIVKVITMIVYVAVKLLFLFVFRVTCSEVPFATFVSFLVLYGTIKIWPTIGILAVAFLTCLELIITTLIIVDIRRTSFELKKAEYTKHRTSILGFRFFLHQQITFNVIFIATYAVLLFGLPIGVQVLQFFLHYDEIPGRGSYFNVQYAPFGLQLCIFAFIATEAYTHLPADCDLRYVLFPCLRRTPPHRPPPLKPVLYRSREPASLPGDLMRIEPHCFVMQTNIELFNLSWYAYYHGTPKARSLNLDLNSLGLKIRHCLYDVVSDTRAIVAETPDRIIFAFKGTSSSQNLRTDLRVHHRSLASVVAAKQSPTHAGRRMQAHFRSMAAFRRARVHAGFANAYTSIKDGVIGATAALLHEQKRPICFTGHSLGGALATLSSLDVQLALGVDAKNVAVSTFGSPRVGNEAFQQVYDEAVSTHWRFVAGGDLISRLPKVGYRHVGRKVILTATGELFIDPSALEIVLWHSQSASIVHHRKACYLLALKAWCDSRGDYTPNLWPFPVSRNDSRKFDSTFRKPDSHRRGSIASGVLPRVNTSGLGSSRHGLGSAHGSTVEDRAKRMQVYADAIDALDGGKGDGRRQSNNINETGIQLWCRLGRTVLAKLGDGDAAAFENSSEAIAASTTT